MINKQILIVEDEPTINRMLVNYFKKEGYTVYFALNGVDGVSLFKQHDFNLVCLDIMMPQMNGWDVAKIIRESSDIPIIMMSALSEEEDILKGYSLKVDDYITKPFNPKVLVAKVNNMLSRIDQPSKPVNTKNILKTNHITMNTDTHRVFIDEQEITLSKKEFELLRYFIENEGKVCSRDHLLDEIWGFDVYVEDRIVDTYVKKIRKHLTPYSDFIKTIFGVGYRFESYVQKT